LRKLALGTLLAALPLTVMAAAPATAGGPVETTIVQHVSCGGHPDPNLCVYSGFVDSTNAKCLPGRTVKMFRFINGEIKLVDTGKTSRRGGFGGVGPPSDVSAAKAKVLKRVVGSGANRVVCRGASYTGA